MDEQDDPVFDGAYELYQEIRDNRGLHLRDGNGRDDILYEELQQTIGCEDQEIVAFLKETDQSAEWLLRQFLQLAAPFAQMFTDIWDFVSSETAPRATEDLRVTFGFEENNPTEIDLEQFREWAATAMQITNGVNVAYWSDEAVNNLLDLKDHIDVDNHHNTGYSRGEPYELPIIETNHNDDFEDYIRRIRELFQYAIDQQAQTEDTMVAFGVSDTAPQTPIINLTDFLPAWEPIFSDHHTVSEEDRRQAETFFEEHIEPNLELERITASLEYQSPLEILRLPFWEHRWHTYEVWMTVQTLKAFDQFNPQVRIDDGRIPIDVRDEAIVAELARTTDPKGYVVSELRTPYETQEREAIQPDLSLCKAQADEATGAPISATHLDKDSRVLIIEYKQHAQLSPSHAEERAESYLDGSPNAAGLIMVNYDAPTDVAFPDDAQLIGNVRPGSPRVEDYHNELKAYTEELDLFRSLQTWTLLLDVSGSMGDIYTNRDIKDALLKLVEQPEPDTEMYTFNAGLTDDPRISAAEIKSGLSTHNGTNVTAAIEGVVEETDPENLLVVTDQDDVPLESFRDDLETIETCAAEDLLDIHDRL